jgi:phosphoglycolate phosphatase
VKEALSALKAGGAELCILTNKLQKFAQQALELHGIAHNFSLVLGGDSFAEKKPNPRGVLYCMERFQATQENTLYVGDSSTDVQTARNAGVAVWALPYGYNHGVPIEQSQPDRLITDLSVFL